MMDKYNDCDIIEDIYRITNEWEAVELRLPPYVMFEDSNVDTEDIAELLVELKQKYDFEVTDYPECVQDIIDLVQHRPFKRLRPKQLNDGFNYKPFVPLKKSFIERIIDFLSTRGRFHSR